MFASRPTRPTCEVCIDSVAGAEAAVQGGADRVELCANLVEGGTTPSTGMIRAVRRVCSLPIMVMIRPRGGHFCFSPAEVETMWAEAEAVLAEDVAGIVIGALNRGGQIDLPTCDRLCELAQSRSVTFHRAFDHVIDPLNALEILIELGIDRVLTSGQAPTAEAGIDRLRQWVVAARERIGIMPGCGVRADNVLRILQQTGASDVHFSGSQLVASPVEFWRDDVPMSAGSTPGDLHRRVTSADQVREICRAARSSS